MPGEDERFVEVDGRELRISRPDKVYFPGLGATKSDLVTYYLEIGDHLLNTARGRPAMLQRFPDGATGKSFYQKRIPAGAPDWLQSTIVSTPNGTTSNALVVADLAHVIWAVNVGCLGLHLWPYLAADPAHADELRIDLDPTKSIGFDEVRTTALRCRDLLEELGLRGYPKTTGSHGLHVYLRLEPRWDSVQVRAGALALARELERRFPDDITANWWKEERGSRVFVDFNQNAPHKTVFGAWFARPAPAARSRPRSRGKRWSPSSPTISPSRRCPNWCGGEATRGPISRRAHSHSSPCSSWRCGTARPASTMRRGHPSTPRCPTSRHAWHPAVPRRTREGGDDGAA